MRDANKAFNALQIGTKLRGGDYVVEGVLGTGGFGITYLAREPLLERCAAIKEFFPNGCRRHDRLLAPDGDWTSGLLDQFRSGFLREGRLLARLRHPGIVPIFSVFEENNSAYLVMDHIEGRTLRDYVSSQQGRLPYAEAVGLIRQAAEALAVIHSHGMLHRDLKPANMMLRPDGRLILIDFGSAREMSSDRLKHTSLLTHGYAPFEQYDEYGVFGPPTDIYALSAVLYHLITGRVPLNAISRRNGMAMSSPREILVEVAEYISSAVMRGLEMEPENRPSTAQEFIDLLTDTARKVACAIDPARSETGESGGCPEPDQVLTEIILPVDHPASRGPAPRKPVLARMQGGSDIQDFECIRVLRGRLGAVDCVRWSLDGSKIIFLGRDSRIWTWDPSTDEPFNLASDHGASSSVDFSPDGKYFATGGRNIEVLMWDTAAGSIECRMAGHTKPVFSVAWSANTGHLASGSADGTARIWDTETGQSLAVLTGHRDRVTSVSWNPMDQSIATAGDDRTVRIWDSEQGKLLHLLQGRMSAVSSVCWSPDGRRIAAAGHSAGSVWIWDVEGEWVETALTLEPDKPLFAIHSVAWRPGGTELALACQDGTVQVWDSTSGSVVTLLRKHAGPVRSVAWSADGRQLATASQDQTVRIWSAPNSANSP